MNVINPFMSSDDILSFSPSIEVQNEYVEQLDDEPSYALDSPKYFEEDTLPYSIIIEEDFLKENGYLIQDDVIFQPILERTNYQPSKDDKIGNYYQVSVTPFIKKVDKDGNEVEVKELWIPIHSVITDDTIDSQIYLMVVVLLKYPSS